MANKARKTPKGSNGTGDSLTVLFDRSDPAERRALEAARLLAAKHGRRKSAIIALLEAVYAHYEATGELLSANEISGALITVTAEGRSTASFSSALSSAASLHRSTETAPQARKAPQQRRTSAVQGANGGKASAETVAKNFLNSMKGLATGFFD